MEIERKYLISSVPFDLSSYPCRKIEQGYLSTAPVVRIRCFQRKEFFMEIERKYLISSVPFDLSSYPCRKIEQGYLSTAPVVRIRRDNNDYILTYKSKGMMIREEYNLPLTKESYEHLKEKIDGRLITKKRYVIPLKDFLFIELDIFSGDLAPLMLAEVEFPDEETANHFTPPEWFGEDVTFSSSYHNSTLSKL